jgi:hypothetical protein
VGLNQVAHVGAKDRRLAALPPTTAPIHPLRSRDQIGLVACDVDHDEAAGSAAPCATRCEDGRCGLDRHVEGGERRRAERRPRPADGGAGRTAVPARCRVEAKWCRLRRGGRPDGSPLAASRARSTGTRGSGARYRRPARWEPSAIRRGLRCRDARRAHHRS